MNLEKEISIFELLDLTDGIAQVHGNIDLALPPSKAYILKELKEKDFGIDYVYFSGDFPTIYYKRVNYFTEETLKIIRETHRKIWNQGKVAFLYVQGVTELRIYNCYHRPINPNDPNKSITDAEIFQTSISDSENLKELATVFGKTSIESGSIGQIEKYAVRLNHKKVNQVLIENLKFTRRLLNTTLGVDKDIIHDLLLRSLFILYLEDRAATDPGFYEQFAPAAKSYYDLLESHLEGTYLLFAKLEASFNGNLCPITTKEKNVISSRHLRLMRECFWDKIEISGQQKLFDWKAFDFKYIPIELISEIYEEFLKVEEGEIKKSNDGAYYTPHALVEFILNKVLPWGNAINVKYDLKVLDPTCGSGIFLVESFKRLIDRWEHCYPEEQITFEDLKKILKDNIFGIEYNPEAIKVTAFSLYLAMLDKLEPKTLWKDKSFPYLIYNPNNSNSDTQGNNLFLMSSLAPGPFTEINFDILVGNPPFKEGKLDEETKKYLADKQFPQEKVVAFLDRSLELCPEGRIALIAASKPVLFNNGSRYKNFRKFLFNHSYVEEIYNFSILRRAPTRNRGNLFTSAVGPAIVIFFQKQKPEDSSDTIIYCAPKVAFKNHLIDGIAIDHTDVKFIPRAESENPDSKIWKISMWGSQRDFSLIQRLRSTVPTIEEELIKRNWPYGRGFQVSFPAAIRNEEIKSYSFIDAGKVERYYIPESNFSTVAFTKFSRIGAVEAYKGPHVLLKTGLQNNKFCASYVSRDCSFKDAIVGIGAPLRDDNVLKTLTLYFNSSFATYFIFLTASSWGIEREKVMYTESLSLPAIVFGLKEDQLILLSKYYDRIKDLENQFLNYEYELSLIEKEIDEFFYAALGIRKAEKILISDFLQHDLDLFIKGSRSAALKRSTVSEIALYTEKLCESINQLLKFGNRIFCWAKIFHIRNNPLTIVALVFNSVNSPNYIEEVEFEAATADILYEIEKYSYQKHSESIYFRRVIKYERGDTLYLVKPNEKRFWTQSSALIDADEIVLDIANA